MSIEMITKRMTIVSDLEKEVKNIKTHYEESLENNQQYQQYQQDINKMREETKQNQEKIAGILNNPSYKAMLDELKDKRQELKEQKEALAQELADYYKDNGTLEIQDPEGNTKRIKFSAKLVK